MGGGGQHNGENENMKELTMSDRDWVQWNGSHK